MLKKTITYTDYNGTTRTENFYFNLNRMDIVEMSIGEKQDLGEILSSISSETNPSELYKLIKSLVDLSYGKKSSDGKRFNRSKENLEAFQETEAYSNMISEMILDANKALDFINAIVPKDFLESFKTSDDSGSNQDSEFSVIKE